MRRGTRGRCDVSTTSWSAWPRRAPSSTRVRAARAPCPAPERATEQRPHVFELLYTTKAQGRRADLGITIGLGTVVEGGTILIARSPLGGARFTVRLPADPRGAASVLALRNLAHAAVAAELRASEPRPPRKRFRSRPRDLRGCLEDLPARAGRSAAATGWSVGGADWLRGTSTGPLRWRLRVLLRRPSVDRPNRWVPRAEKEALRAGNEGLSPREGSVSRFPLDKPCTRVQIRHTSGRE